MEAEEGEGEETFIRPSGAAEMDAMEFAGREEKGRREEGPRGPSNISSSYYGMAPEKGSFRREQSPKAPFLFHHAKLRLAGINITE